MEQLINDIHNLIKDYRITEGYGVSKERITSWINQFSEDDKEFILQEIKFAFEKMYLSKKNASRFLFGVIKKLSKDLGYKNHKDFLNNARFLDLQSEGKSQKELLKLLKKVLEKKFNYKYSNLGSKSSKHNIYVDDVLCTGNTFYRNIKDWVTKPGKQRLKKLKNNKIDLIIVYVLISEKHYYKKIGQFYHNVDKDFRNLLRPYARYWFKKELLKPIRMNQSNSVTEYESKVIEQVNEHTAGKYSTESNFYRNEQVSEDFYTSIENRKRLEKIFLEKGIDILNNSNVSKKNIRPLGYSLPSYKDFGFGILFFSWRNVPNNSPLVFWYQGQNFMPLFVNKR